jgi:glutamate-ammonia-ligase adenylyltransferase
VGEVPAITDAALTGQYERLRRASRFAAKLCDRNPELLRELLASGDLQRSYEESELDGRLAAALTDVADRDVLLQRLRQLRQREILRVMWRDFNDLAPTMETTRDMSLLAEACIARAADWLHRELVTVCGEPLGDDGEPQRLLVIAMGKLGARELNLSSDVDLVFAYPESGQTQGGPRSISNQEFFIKLGQRLIKALDQTTVDGFVFRVDMRLRPYGDSGALVLNFAALEEYYQDQGRDWERYALIKARVITGDPSLREVLSAALQPFVYRRYIDFGAIESLRNMKQMISAEVRRRGLQEDVKLGPGGIREIEFIAQCFQLIRGGRSAALRQRSLLAALEACAAEGCLPVSAVEELCAAYLFLRDTEHAIQGWEDKQTQSLPAADDARNGLLAALGLADWDSFMALLDGHRDRVSAHFAALIAEPEERVETEAGSPWPDSLDPAALAGLGFDDAELTAAQLQEFADSKRLQFLQAEGRERLDQFMPRLLRACVQREEASVVLARLLPLVQAIVRRSAYLALLLENPAALLELVQLCAASPWISEQLTRHPVLLDELLDARSLYSMPGKGEIRDALGQQLSRLAPDDLEANMDALRYFRNAQVLHVAASEVTGRLPLMRVSDRLTWLAEVILESALAIAWTDLVRKHGRPQLGSDETGFAVIGYGKLGGIELGHGSDLDLVFLYDAADGGVTEGDRPLENTVFYTRLGQRLIHVLTAGTALGTLYEIDMRLRPSGNSGLLVSSMDAFREYQRKTAWTWEHQALVRARVVAGDPAVAESFDALRREVLETGRNEAELAAEVKSMRAKMQDHLLAEEAADGGRFHLKQGSGGIVDIEFMVQYAVLAWSHRFPSLAAWSDNIRILEALANEGLFSERESSDLTEAYIAYRSAAHELALQQREGVVDAGQFAQHREAVRATWNRLLGE